MGKTNQNTFKQTNQSKHVQTMKLIIALACLACIANAYSGSIYTGSGCSGTALSFSGSNSASGHCFQSFGGGSQLATKTTINDASTTVKVEIWGAGGCSATESIIKAEGTCGQCLDISNGVNGLYSTINVNC